MGTVHAKDLGGSTAASSSGAQAAGDACGPDGNKMVRLSSVEARIDKIHVEGLSRTKDDVVIDTVSELFLSRDFGEVIANVHKVRGKLEKLGCFRNIGIFIDTSTGADATANGLEVTFFVKELKRMTGGVTTLVGNNEGSLVVGMEAPNMLGRGEKLQAEYSYGSRRTNNLSLSFVKPLHTKYDALFKSSVFQHSSDWPWSGFRQIDRGFLLDLGFNSACTVRHNLQYEASWRELGTLTKTSSFEVREESGHTLKSSLRHILSVDRRDAVIFPTTGTLFRFTTELAGIGGDIGFLKNDGYLQLNFPLPGDMVLQGTLQGGYLRPMFDKNIGLPDRFYLGGPMSVRGFETRGIGPRADGNAIGASVAWGAGLHLYTPLPFRPGQGGFGDLFRIHFFTNIGHCDNFEFTDDYAENSKTLFRGYRLSYGAGLALKLGQMARVELNYVIPQAYETSDVITPGVQFGVGLQFL